MGAYLDHHKKKFNSYFDPINRNLGFVPSLESAKVEF